MADAFALGYRRNMRGIIVWIIVLTATFAVTGGCQKSRFASCETDDDCKSSNESKPYCFNLRCVACAYDRHCEPGEICDLKSRTCADI